jgi:hypothetical protein
MITLIHLVFLVFLGRFDFEGIVPSGLLSGDGERFFSWETLKNIFFLCTVILIGAFLLGSFLTSQETSAELEKMSNEELSQVSGKNLLDFVVEDGQTDVSGSFGGGDYQYRINNDGGDRLTTYTRIELNTQIKVDPSTESQDGVEIGQLSVGHYDNTETIGNDVGGYITGNGNATDGESFYFGPNFSGFGGLHGQDGSTNEGSTGNGSNIFDIRGNGLVLQPGGESGCSGPDCLGSSVDVVARGPYVELAYEEWSTGDEKELVGVRFGVEKLRGAASIQSLSTLSGTIKAQDFGDNGECSAAGHRITSCSTTAGANALGLFNKVQFGTSDGSGSGSQWGNNNGWTEDFWLSFNRKDLFWRHQNPASGTSNGNAARFHTDGEGFWIHATDEIQGGVS